MNATSTSVDFWRTLSAVLLRCWVFGFVFLLIWAGAIWFFDDDILRLHGKMFGITKHELDLIFYCGMGLLKLLVFVFFFFPWLAIRMVVGKAAT